MDLAVMVVVMFQVTQMIGEVQVYGPPPVSFPTLDLCEEARPFFEAQAVGAVPDEMKPDHVHSACLPIGSGETEENA